MIKHNNPCGAATSDCVATSLRRALDGDPVSAFGSIVGINGTVDVAAAELFAEPGLFVEAIIARHFDPAALTILTTRPKWKNNVRLLSFANAASEANSATHRTYRYLAGGMLVQDADHDADDESTWRVVTEAQPDNAMWAELRFAWSVCRYVKSNAIVVTREQALCGVGAGQMSRVDSVEIAIKKAGERIEGAVLASDAFFPFDDSVHAAASAGIRALIQPGGSKRDSEVIAACNEHRLPMVFTHRRHFRH